MHTIVIVLSEPMIILVSIPLYLCSAEHFAKMFPDSSIAKEFQCGETKSAYISKFGLVPHFKQLLSNKIKNDDYVLLFDKRLNGKTQPKQCHFRIRHWDGNKVMSWFFDSPFMGHTAANDLTKTHENSTEEMSKSDTGFHEWTKCQLVILLEG